MNPLKLIVVTGLILLASGGATWAQEAESSTTQVRLRLLAFDRGAAFEEAYLHDVAATDEVPGEPVEIKTYLNHETATLGLRGRRLVFTTSEERESMEKPDELIARATLPEGTRSAILLFLPEGGGEGPPRWKVLAVPDGDEAFPSGSFRVFNLSAMPVRIDLEGTAFGFKAGQAGLIEDPPMAANRHAGMSAAVFEDRSWKRIASGAWPDPGEGRVLQILYRDPRSRRIYLRAFDDIAPEALAQDAAAAADAEE